MSPPRLTSYPPFTIFAIVPETGSFSSNALRTSFHICFASAFDLETSGPFLPFFLRRTTVTTSPTFGRSSANSVIGSLASDLYPISRNTESLVTWITLPSTSCPSSNVPILFRDSSNCVWMLFLES